VLDVTSTFENLEVFNGRLFGFDDITRQIGNGRYDLTFVAPLTKNAMAFEVASKNPATDPAEAVLTAGSGTATFPVQNESGNESTPIFLGFIASTPIASVALIEGPETNGEGNEEVALDNFVVGQLNLGD
jgi:hypothetical protein